MSGSLTQNIVIAVTATGVPVVQRSLEQIGQSAVSAHTALEAMISALAAIGLGIGVAEIVKAADAFSNMQNRLTAVGTSANDLAAVYSRLQQISLETHNSIESTVNLYSRLEQGVKSLGYSQNEALSFTETLSAAVKLSGASSQEAKYAIQDLAHGISAGSINGRELNGILREMPSLAILIAQSFNVPVGRLKEFAKEGKLTTDGLIQGMAKLHNEEMAKLQQRILTVADAIQDMKTRTITFIGEMSRAGGASLALANAIETLSKNLNTIVGVLLSVGAAFFVFVGIPAILGAITSGFIAMTLAMLSNPFLALAAILTSAATALTYFRDEINLGIDKTTTLGDLMRAVWEALGPAIAKAKAYMVDFLNYVITGWGDATAKMTALDWVVGIAKGIDIMVGAFKLAWALIGSFAQTATGVMETAIYAVGQLIYSAIIAPINLAMKGMNVLSGVTGKEFEMFQGALDWSKPLDRLADGFKRAQDAGAAFRATVDGSLNGTSGLSAQLQNLVPRAQEIGKARVAAAGVDNSYLDARGPRIEPEKKVTKAHADKLQTQLEAIEGKFDNILKYVNEYNKAIKVIEASIAAGKISPQEGSALLGEVKQEIHDKIMDKYNSQEKAAHQLKIELRDLDGAVKAGFITQQEANYAAIVAKSVAEDHINVVKKYVEEEKRKQDLSKLGTEDQKIQNELHKVTQQWIQKGVILTDDQIRSLRDLTKATEELTRAGEYRNSILDASAVPMKDLATGQVVLNELFASGKITLEQYSVELDKLKYKALQSGLDIGSGIERAFIKMDEQSKDLASTSEAAVNGVFSKLTDVVTKFVETGKFGFAELLKTIQSFAIKLALQIIEIKASQALMSAAGGGSGGGAGGLGGMIGNLIGGSGGSGAASAFDGAGTGASSFDFSSVDSAYGFASGGEFMVGGNGGTDSQFVAFRASPDEKVSITRPDQVGSGKSQVMAPAPQVNVRVVNSIDPAETIAAMSGSEGERLILNVIQRNKNAVKQATR